jgi:cellulose synthase/poly-beta-1,6-N-acetylglucosamine synthase-like glycosyltransferase
MGLWVRSGTATDEPGKPRRRFTLRPRFIVAAVLLLIVINLLALEAYANARFVPDQRGEEGGPQKTIPAAVINGGQIISQNAQWTMPPSTVALTFDDGPDPRWTPQILDVLAKYHVPATFFVVGSQVARHPGIADRMVREGHELGVHTFTHPDVTGLPGWRRRAEYAQTEMAISHAISGARPEMTRVALYNTPKPLADPGNIAPTDWRATAIVWGIHAADGLVALFWAVLIAVGALTLLRTLFLCVYAISHARQRRKSTWSWGEKVTEPVSVIVPAWNEREGIAGTVKSLVASSHDVEVVVVDDASTDGTAAVVEKLKLPGVRVVRVPKGGKAAAINTGIALSKHPIIVMVDADTVVEPEAIHRLVQPFGDPSVGAVAGNVKVGNRKSMVARWQHIEYVIGFNLDRRLYESFDCIPTVPGALGAFRRLAVQGAGGITDDTLAEDTDLTIAVHRHGWRVVYIDDARSWTEAPATIGQLWRQRYRWSYGTMQALWKHRAGLRDPGRPGRFGRRGLPLLALFTVVLPLLAPLVDIFAIYGLLFLNRTETAVAWLAVMLVQTLTAILAFKLDREKLRPLWALPLQQIVYRQLMYLVLVHSMVTAASGGRLHWQKLNRTGEAAHSAPPATAA